jgi:hypothetical protein
MLTKVNPVFVQNSKQLNKNFVFFLFDSSREIRVFSPFPLTSMPSWFTNRQPRFCTNCLLFNRNTQVMILTGQINKTFVSNARIYLSDHRQHIRIVHWKDDEASKYEVLFQSFNIECFFLTKDNFVHMEISPRLVSQKLSTWHSFIMWI